MCGEWATDIGMCVRHLGLIAAATAFLVVMRSHLLGVLGLLHARTKILERSKLLDPCFVAEPMTEVHRCSCTPMSI